MNSGKTAFTIGLLGAIAGAGAYKMMPHKKNSQTVDGMRKAANELAGVSKELGKAIRSIGDSMN